MYILNKIMKINYFIIVFFVISYSFSIGAEIDIILSEDFLASQKTLKDFQLTLLHINSNEEKFLDNIFKIFEKNFSHEQKNFFKQISSRKSIVVANNELYCLKKLLLKSLDKEKIIKEKIFTVITINKFSEKNQTFFNIKVEISVNKETLTLSLYNYNEDVFKKNFLS